jgi:hypothetical protein
MKDFTGREIRPHDRIVYCGRRGSLLYLREATVLYTFDDTVCGNRTDNGRTVTLHRPPYIAVVEVPCRS